MSFYICPRCGNQDESYLGKKKDGSLYCRRCISFQGEEVQEKPLISPNISLVLNYSLTPFQKELSNQIIKNYLLGKDTLIHAVCGAGKTELIFGVIETCLKQGGHPGFAVPRKDVAKELYTRFQEAFPNAKCVLVYGDHHEELVGDIILLTTHQLYRYPQYFDLLIVDEIDAFPYKGNFVLSSFLKKAVKGRLVLMSATPPEDVLEEFTKENHEILHLNARFHLSPIPVPKFHEWFLFFQRVPIIFYLKNFKRKENQLSFLFPQSGNVNV